MNNNASSTEEDEGTNDRTLMYYVNDGVYGSFNCILYDHAHCLPTLHKVSKTKALKCHQSFSSHKWTVVVTCMCSPLPLNTNRSQSQMRSGTLAVSGVQRVMALIALLSSVTCQTCRWVTGWSLRTWVPTLLQLPPLLMASNDPTYTMLCPALPGE